MTSLRALVACFAAVLTLTVCADTLEERFDAPPDSTKPYMYWYWLNNNVSAKGITADLEAMRRAGVGEAFIGHVISDGIPEGTVPILSPSWWQLVEFAVRAVERIGVRGMFNCPMESIGRPWISPKGSATSSVPKPASRAERLSMANRPVTLSHPRGSGDRVSRAAQHNALAVHACVRAGDQRPCSPLDRTDGVARQARPSRSLTSF